MLNVLNIVYKVLSKIIATLSKKKTNLLIRRINADDDNDDRQCFHFTVVKASSSSFKHIFSWITLKTLIKNFVVGWFCFVCSTEWIILNDYDQDFNNCFIRKEHKMKLIGKQEVTQNRELEPNAIWDGSTNERTQWSACTYDVRVTTTRPIHLKQFKACLLVTAGAGVGVRLDLVFYHKEPLITLRANINSHSSVRTLTAVLKALLCCLDSDKDCPRDEVRNEIMMGNSLSDLEFLQKVVVGRNHFGLHIALSLFTFVLFEASLICWLRNGMDGMEWNQQSRRSSFII